MLDEFALCGLWVRANGLCGLGKQAPRNSLRSDRVKIEMNGDDADAVFSAVSVPGEKLDDYPSMPVEVENHGNVIKSAVFEPTIDEEVQEGKYDEVQEEVQEDTVLVIQTPELQAEATESIDMAESKEHDSTMQGEESHGTKEVIQEDTLPASSSPALEDVRALLSPTTKGDTTPFEELSPLGHDETEIFLDQGSRKTKLTNLLEGQTKENLFDSLHAGESLSLVITPSLQDRVQEYPPGKSQSPNPRKQSSPATSSETPSLEKGAAKAVVQDISSPSPSLSKAEENVTKPGPPISATTEHLPPSTPGVSGIDQGLAFSNAQSVPSSLPKGTPRASAAKLRQSKRLLAGLSPDGSPQIGTSLLRRESLRSKETPSKKRELRKTKTPKKRDTLSRRDTLQEREILQKVIAETNQDPSPGKADTATAKAQLPSSDDFIAATGQTENHEHPIDSDRGARQQPGDESATGAEGPVQISDDAKVEKDLHRAMEAIEVFQHPTDSEASGISAPDEETKTEEMKAIDNTNKMIAEAELEEVTQTVEAVQEQTEPPSRTTRSGSRYSDDTSLLRDFLNRAQASKAAKTPVLTALEAPKPQTSPRRSPRKALGPRKGNASTTKKSVNIANRPGTPPGITKVDNHDSDDTEEIGATPTSCRRSTRTRLPAPSKAAPPGAPSFIPVRRADGTDPVVLQKSQAQELAIVTRANTRRNKGQSKPPLLALKEIVPGSADSADAKQRAGENGKSVGWATTIASYQEPKEQAEEVEESKPKVRRIRGLGAANNNGNGTPGPKKTTGVMGSSNGTPARRGKAR